MSECMHCGAVAEPEHGIVVGSPGEGDGTTCNVCLQAHLREVTVLSERESEVAALKLLGHQHGEIAELLNAFDPENRVAKSTVDEYSRRMKEKVERAAATTAELEEFL